MKNKTRQQEKRNKQTKKVFLICLTTLATLAITGTIYAISITTPTGLNYKTLPSNTTMQTFTKAECAAMSTYATIVLTDERGETDYRIRKMPDGRCWMIDNLKLSIKTEITATDTNIEDDAGSDFIEKWNTLRQSTTNGNPVQSIATHGNGICTDDTDPSVTIANGSGHLTCNGLIYADTNDGYIAYSDPSSVSGSTTHYYYNCTNNNGINPNSLTGCGYLYNWYTATAGSGRHDNLTTTRNVSSSICPAGWTLPKGAAISTQNEFGILNNAMATGATTSSTSNTVTTRPNWYAEGPFEGSLAGDFNAGFIETGSYGDYWSSSTFLSANMAHRLSFDYSVLYPGQGSTTRSHGMAVRCLL